MAPLEVGTGVSKDGVVHRAMMVMSVHVALCGYRNVPRASLEHMGMLVNVDKCLPTTCLDCLSRDEEGR